MLSRVNYFWRVFATGFSFAMFGLGGLFTTVFVVPLLHCLPGGETRRSKRVQRFFHWTFRGYIEMMRLLGLLTYAIEHRDRLDGARLVLANHPSLLDVVFLISLLPNANCIVKGPLSRNFFTRVPVRAAGYIFNEAPDDVIEAANRGFASGQSLIIFPEGTRTTPSKPLNFKRGAAQVAIRTGSDITPVLIYCEPTTLTKNERWYQVPPRRVHFRILVGDRIPIDQYTTNTGPARGARQLTRDLAEYFAKELKAHG